MDRVASAIAYLRSSDTTLMGSRNGHAVLSIWSRLMGHGACGYRADVRACLARTARLVASLRAADVPVLCNPYSLTVVFPQPGEAIVRTYQLACNKGEAHAIVMPNVTDALIGRFVSDYLAWWKARDTRAPQPLRRSTMRGFQESKVKASASITTCERADFLVKIEPHPSWLRKPTAENEAGHKNGNGTKPARRAKC